MIKLFKKEKVSRYENLVLMLNTYMGPHKALMETDELLKSNEENLMKRYVKSLGCVPEGSYERYGNICENLGYNKGYIDCINDVFEIIRKFEELDKL